MSARSEGSGDHSRVVRDAGRSQRELRGTEEISGGSKVLPGIYADYQEAVDPSLVPLPPRDCET